MSTQAIAQEGTETTEIDPFANLTWRNVGPAAMGGRVADVEGVAGDPALVYVGSASGGVWKSTNGGVTWQPLFDEQPIASIGDLALEPGNPDVIYAGTGESNVRNSVSFGNGVYRSKDGGKTWNHLGLDETKHISRIVVNPRDPSVVIVGALGHIYGPNEERGVFRSEDGGENWEQVLHIDDRHGVADLDINPKNPNIVYAGMWHFERKPWTHTSGSEDGGLFRSVDGGKTWKKLEKGLPKLVGRIGVKVAPSNPSVVYAMMESNEGTLFRSEDGGTSFEKVNDSTAIVSRGFYYTDLRVDPQDENRVYAIAAGLFASIDGGRSFERISRSTHGDYHSLWIDPEDPRRLWQGQDGGVAVSYDRGDTWEYVNNFALAQFYQIYADNREPFYYIGGGLQDNGSWYGPSRSRETQGIMNREWKTFSGGDGYFVVVHPDDPELFLSEYQGGGIMRTDMRSREQIDASPQPRRNDGGPVSELQYRFNWDAPIVPSPHDKDTVYFAGNVVFRTKDFGLTWNVISPDLTTNDTEKQQDAGGPIWVENTTAEYHCSIISFAESPAQAGILWAGTDDGRLQVSQDDGQNWADVTSNVSGIPEFSPVSHVEPSRTAAGTAYASFDRHMFDDYGPHVFKTTDFGKSWTNVTDNLPETAYVHVIKEDPRNTNLIYAGTELGLYASHKGGGGWTRLHLKNLPTVAIHDIIVHPRENDLILGSHGRGLWVFDDATPLQDLAPGILSQPIHLFDVRPGLRFRTADTVYGFGEKPYRAPNPPYGALITYYLKEKPEEDAPLAIEILKGTEIVKALKNVPQDVGLNRVAWNLTHESARPRRYPDEESQVLTDYGDEDERPGSAALPGTYTVRLTFGDQTLETPVEVRVDPTLDVSAADLEKQFDATMKIRDLLSHVNDALRDLDSVKAQLTDRKKLLSSRKADDELISAVESEIENLDKLSEGIQKPAEKRYWATGPKIVERLGELFRGLNFINAAPTGPQLALLEELSGEVDAAVASIRKFSTENVAGINVKLREAGYPEISTP
jgi:photosystem II stability/assembly factor-like uncharacterized protein